MKKIIKSLSLFCLMIAMCIPVLCLAGCAKNYTITISIAGGEGSVFKTQSESVSVVGKNTVKGDTLFEYFVKPAKHYEIDKIVVDGEEIEVTNTDGVYLYFDKVDANHNVEVSFKAESYAVALLCKKDGEEGYEVYKTLILTYGTNLDLGQNEYGGANNELWYTMKTVNGTLSPVKVKADSNNVVFVNGTMQIMTDKTRAELTAIIEALGE